MNGISYTDNTQLNVTIRHPFSASTNSKTFSNYISFSRQYCQRIRETQSFEVPFSYFSTILIKTPIESRLFIMPLPKVPTVSPKPLLTTEKFLNQTNKGVTMSNTMRRYASSYHCKREIRHVILMHR